MNITRKNRKTGSIVTAREDDFLGWVTICETHNGWAEHANKTQAVSWLAAPEVWCEHCAKGLVK